MLCDLRVRDRLVPHSGDTVCFLAAWRGILCSSFRSRATPLAPSSRSAAARLSRFAASARPELGRGERNSTGGFYEIPIDDRGSARADRHSERDFAFS